jgi:hypothetical protein
LNPTLQLEIEALVAAAQVGLGVVESLLPAAVVATVALKFSSVRTSNFSLPEYVSDYNAKVKVAQKFMPRNVSLKKIHIHSAFARYGTAGWLK